MYKCTQNRPPHTRDKRGGGGGERERERETGMEQDNIVVRV